MPPMDRVCVIGAGSSGIASCQVLDARGIPFDCFEKGSGIGGNWRYDNDNEMSSAYESLHINTSRPMMQYATYPMPDEYPDFPNHRQIAAYFDDYVDHFGFRDKIRFNTEVTRVERSDGGWEVTLDDGSTHRYRAVMVANGHHWNPRYPEPPFPGEFSGEAGPRPPLPDPEGLRGQERARARVRQLGDGHRRRDLARREHDVPRRAARLPRDSEVPRREAARPAIEPDHAGGCRSCGPPACTSARSRRAGASPRTTGFPSRTTGSDRLTRRSPRTSSLASATATSPSSRTSSGSRATTCASSTARSSRSTESFGARATRSASRSSTTSSSRPVTTRSSCTGGSCLPTSPGSSSSD